MFYGGLCSRVSKARNLESVEVMIAFAWSSRSASIPVQYPSGVVTGGKLSGLCRASVDTLRAPMLSGVYIVAISESVAVTFGQGKE